MKGWRNRVALRWLICAPLASATVAFADIRVSNQTAPNGLESIPVKWIHVESAKSGTMLAAVARPRGRGPFPAILILHGSHGFAREYVTLAHELADHGFLAVAPCWFAGGVKGDAPVSDPIDCPDATPMPMGPSEQAQTNVDELVKAVRQLPDVRADRVALFGHSRGGGASLNYLVHGGEVQAAIFDSAGYTEEFIAAASQIRSPVLILHGTVDTPDNVFTSITRARAFEATMRAAGRPVEAHLYEGGVHNGIFVDARQHSDEVRRIVRFLRNPPR